MSKLKRPEKIQTSTNGVTGTASTTSSPALSAKRPQSGQMPSTSATSNSGGMNGSGPRTVNRPRRDAPPQLLGRGQRTSSAGLRSASIIADSAVAAQVAEPRPYSETTLIRIPFVANSRKSNLIVTF
jgi:transcription factor SPT20